MEGPASPEVAHGLRIAITGIDPRPLAEHLMVLGGPLGTQQLPSQRGQTYTLFARAIGNTADAGRDDMTLCTS